MPAERFVTALNEQIADEFAASQQYVAVAVYYEANTLPQLAGFFYAQAVEERNHAMMMVQYLLDTDASITIPGLEPPQNVFDDYRAPIRLALDQEQRVTKQIGDLFKLAREEGDYLSEHFITWFLKEQVEEEATMRELLDVAERAPHVHVVEEYIAREHPRDEDPDPTAPAAAGGAL
jgi:ferritin